MSNTEKFAERFSNLENWPTDEIVGALIEGQLAAVAAVYPARTALAEAIDKAAKRLEAGGRIVYLGAGTSGRLAALDAAELPPTFSWPYERAIPLMAGGLEAYHRAAEGAEDIGQDAIDGLDGIAVNANDVVIGIAASGRTPYAISGLEYARGKGALTISVTNNPGSKICSAAEINLIADTGAEVVAGSTRMKAGTAQKVLLTCLSTGIFIRMGYVYRGRMVEMKPTNVKLQERAVLMVAELADATDEDASNALNAADGSIKTAVVMLIGNLNRDEAEALLARVSGRLHLALGELSGALE